MWAGPPVKDGIYDVDDSVTALVRTDGPVFTVHGAWAQNIDAQEDYVDFIGDKGGIRLQYGGDFTLFTVENGAFVKYVPEIPEAKETICSRWRLTLSSDASAQGKSCHPISTQQLRPLRLCRLFMIPQSNIGKLC